MAVNRNSKAISFLPLATDFTARISGASKPATDIIRHVPPPEEKDPGCVAAVFKEMHTELNGSGLDAMNRAMMQNLGTVLDSFQTDGGQEIDLLKWSRSTITMANTDAVFGPGNPFRSQPSLDADFWSVMAPFLCERRSELVRLANGC